jgi:hypothetical protein
MILISHAEFSVPDKLHRPVAFRLYLIERLVISHRAW